MAIKPAAGANALETVEAIKKKMEEMAPTFPPGVRVIYPYDTTPFVRLSIEEVIKTLLEAIALVFLVMFLFLQSWRATLIPTIAVPVVLLGTFGVMAAAGFSINTLTLFGLVLAIGLLVDDAIVVVENVERVMREENLSPRDAARKSMDQISGALIGIGLVLCAAFAPMAFFSGSSGVIFRQFSLTMVSAVVLSVAVALILTPALCATLLKPAPEGGSKTPASRRGFFGWFNRVFDRGADGYTNLVRVMLRHILWPLVAYGIIAAAVTGPRSSIGSPITFRIRPSVPGPTGTEIGAPVSVTSAPRTMPSVLSIAMQRTVRSPISCATSSTSVRSPILRVSAFWI